MILEAFSNLYDSVIVWCPIIAKNQPVLAALPGVSKSLLLALLLQCSGLRFQPLHCFSASSLPLPWMTAGSNIICVGCLKLLRDLPSAVAGYFMVPEGIVGSKNEVHPP